MPRDVKSYIERSVELSKGNSSSSSNTSKTSKSSGEIGGASQAYVKEVNKMGDKLDRSVLGMTMGWQDRYTASTASHDTATRSKPATGQKTSVSSTQRSNAVEPKSKERVSSQPQTKPKETVTSKEDKPTVSSSSTKSYPTSSSPRSRSPRRHSPTRRSSSPARSTWESEQRKEEQERLAKQKQEEEARSRREAATQQEWDQLANEIQKKWGHTEINSLAEGITKRDQIKADIEKVKSYKQYTFLNKNTIEQVLRKLEKSYRQVKEVMKEPKARAIQEDFKQMMSEIEQRIQNIEAEEMPIETTSDFNKAKATLKEVKEDMRKTESNKQSAQEKLPAAQEEFERARANAFKFGKVPYDNDQGEIVWDEYFQIADKSKKKLNDLENNIDGCNYLFKCYLNDLKAVEKELTAIEKAMKEQKEKLKGEREELREKGVTDISQAGLELIANYEGCSLKVYKDVAGIETIGYGHVILPGEDFSKGITQEKALELFRQDINEAIKGVKSYVKVPLSQHEFDALVSFTFNVGGPRLKKSTLLKLINSGNKNLEEIRNAFMLLKKAKVEGELKPVEGLITRREQEAKLFLEGIYG